MRKTQTEVNCAAELSWLEKMANCALRAPHQSPEDMKHILELVEALVVHVTDKLLNAVVSAEDYWTGQYFNYEIEKRVNLHREPFGSSCRKQSFCMCGGLDVKRAAAQFLKNFDKLNRHYGWHKDESRDKWQENACMGSLIPKFKGSHDAVQEQASVPPVDRALLDALPMSAHKLQVAVMNDLPEQLSPQCRLSLAKALQPDLERRVASVLLAHPDWTTKRIAKEVGVNRTSLYRLKIAGVSYIEAKANFMNRMKADGKPETPNANKGRKKKTGTRN